MKTTVQLPFYRRPALLLLAVVTVAAAALGAATSFAHDVQRQPDADHIAKQMAERLDDYLDLSGSQEEQIEGILEQSIKQRWQMRQDRQNKMRDLWNQPTLSAAEIKAAMLERQGGPAQREAHMTLMAETLAKIHAVLTPEQREEIAENGMMGFMGGFRQYGGRHHGGGWGGGRHGKYGGRHHGGWGGWWHRDDDGDDR